MLDWKKFSRLYFVLLLLHLVVLFKEPSSGLTYITKPALLLSLIAYFFVLRQQPRTYFQNLFGAGLIFSLIGDILLMREQLFIPGLASFLLAQLCYTFAFYRSNEGSKGWVQKYPLLVIPIVLYGVGLVALLYPHLGDMVAPVIAYAGIIMLMLIAAINRNKDVKSSPYQFIVLGAFLFVISDSLLAFNKFVTPYSWESIAVMLSYGVAQYFLVWGMTEDE